MWLIYEILLIIGFLCYLPKAIWRRRLPHRGWMMRLGRYPSEVTQRLPAPPRLASPNEAGGAQAGLAGRQSLWIHGVSVGEVLAVGPLIRALAQRQPADPIVLSTITPGGFAVAKEQCADWVIPIYFPLDLRGCVRRAFAMIRPRLLLLIESELWPTVIQTAKHHGVPVAVINGRISIRAFRRYQRVRPLLQGMLGRVELFLMQTQEDADRLIQLGAPRERVQAIGNLKWEASLSRHPDREELRVVAQQLGLNGHEPLLVAGSTHRGEEAMLLRAVAQLRASTPPLRLVIAPRYLERVHEVEGLIRQAGLVPLRLSTTTPQDTWDVGIVDTFGQLPRYYGLATVVFVGGSLIPHGGQNPLEPASLGKPIVFGPSMHNFAEIARQLLMHHAARQLREGAELTSVFQELLAHPEAGTAMGRRAQELIERSQGACQRTLDALEPLLRK